MAKLLLELYTGRVHSHKTQQHSAVGLTKVISQIQFILQDINSNHEKLFKVVFNLTITKNLKS